MQHDPAVAPPSQGFDRLEGLIAADGSAPQPALIRLADPRVAAADLADALHCLGLLHGQHQGVMETTLGRTDHPVFREWLNVAHEAFARERDWLVRLISAAGPLPSTPGQTASENAIATQRHALIMLAQSDRPGCAGGACIALALDWLTIRRLLHAIAQRLYVDLPPSRLPDLRVSRALYDMTAKAPAIERGLLFGAQQLLAQHRGLWHLVDARACARSAG